MTKFPRLAQLVPAPALLSPKIFTLWRELLSPNFGLSRHGVEAGLPDWTFLGPNLQNQDHFNHVWTKKNLFGPFELKVWTFFPRQIKLFHKIINIFCHQVHTVYTIDSRHYSSTI